MRIDAQKRAPMSGSHVRTPIALARHSVDISKMAVCTQLLRKLWERVGCRAGCRGVWYFRQCEIDAIDIQWRLCNALVIMTLCYVCFTLVVSTPIG